MKLIFFIAILIFGAFLFFYDAQAIKAKDLPPHVHKVKTVISPLKNLLKTLKIKSN